LARGSDILTINTTSGAVNIGYRAGRFHRKADGSGGIMLNFDGKCQYQVKDLLDDMTQENKDAIVFVCVSYPDGCYKHFPIYKVTASADDLEVYLCLGDEISND
jgi:hypothetical protein